MGPLSSVQWGREDGGLRVKFSQEQSRAQEKEL